MRKVLETNIRKGISDMKRGFQIKEEAVVDMFMLHGATHVSVKSESGSRRTLKATLVATITMGGLKYYHIQVHL